MRRAWVWARRYRRRLMTLLALVCAAAPLRAASTFEIVNLDGPTEGLNDPAPFAAEGGNTAATLGEARLRALELAASLWAELIESPVAIRVGVSFDPLGGTATDAVLGHAGPAAVYRDFAGAPRAGTWYASAAADRLAGLDLGGPGSLDVVVVINSDVDDPVVLGQRRFYLGLDGAPATGDVALAEVVLHEMAHGLGFLDLTDPASGAKLLGWDDAYLVHLERHGASPAAFTAMSDAERMAAAVAEGDVHWTGASAIAAGASLAAGRAAGGHLRVYAPSSLEPGSSLSHFDTTLEPNQLLEPYYLQQSDLSASLQLTRAVLADVGWGEGPACTTQLPSGETLLFREEFDDGTLDGWTILDYGTLQGPSNWTVTNGELVQSSNIYQDPASRGTIAYWAAGLGWKDYRYRVTFSSADDDQISVVFRFRDGNNFYRFDMDRQYTRRRLVKVVNGSMSVLGQQSFAYRTNDKYVIEVSAVGNQLKVLVDGNTVINLTDSTFSSGTVGFASHGNAGSHYDHVEVVGAPLASYLTLLTDDFADGNYNGWTLDSPGDSSGPASWSASGHYLAQTSNIYSNGGYREGTQALWSSGGTWSDYRVSLELWSTDDDRIGVLFRHQDASNFYRLDWAAQTTHLRLVRVVGGVASVLSDQPIAYLPNNHYFVEIEAVGEHLTVWIDRERVIDLDAPGSASGTVGLSSQANAGSYFDNVRVEERTIGGQP